MYWTVSILNLSKEKELAVFVALAVITQLRLAYGLFFTLFVGDRAAARCLGLFGLGLSSSFSDSLSLLGDVLRDRDFVLNTKRKLIGKVSSGGNSIP